MDPDANLNEQRALAASILAIADDDDPGDDELAHDAARLAELVQALDEWLTRTGFPHGLGSITGRRSRRFKVVVSRR